MATVGFGAGQTKVQSAPGATTNVQKTAKEQALAYEANLANGAYVSQAQQAAYGAPVTYKDTPFGKVPVFDATTPK